jgi:hypothetical protein
MLWSLINVGWVLKCHQWKVPFCCKVLLLQLTRCQDYISAVLCIKCCIWKNEAERWCINQLLLGNPTRPCPILVFQNLRSQRGFSASYTCWEPVGWRAKSCSFRSKSLCVWILVSCSLSFLLITFLESWRKWLTLTGYFRWVYKVKYAAVICSIWCLLEAAF